MTKFCSCLDYSPHMDILVTAGIWHHRISQLGKPALRDFRQLCQRNTESQKPGWEWTWRITRSNLSWQNIGLNKMFQHPVQTNLNCPTSGNSSAPWRDSSGWLLSMWNIFLLHPISISSGVTFTHYSHLFHMTPCKKWVSIIFPATL